jgi:hypothetical protein
MDARVMLLNLNALGTRDAICDHVAGVAGIHDDE